MYKAHTKVFCGRGWDHTAIAEILSDMDAEIAALEAKLSTVQDVKQGMMSVLLGGEIILV